jgi:hypothetical protein
MSSSIAATSRLPPSTLRGPTSSAAPGNPYDVAMQHLERAALAFTRGDPARTAELLDAAESTLVEAGIVLDPDDAFEVGWLRAQLG